MEQQNKALVTPEWIIANRDNPKLVLIEIDTDDTSAFDQGHIPGAIGWAWKEVLWDRNMREFPDPEKFARRMERFGISNDSIVVFYGDPIEFGFYGWWTFKYCGHDDVRMLDGGKKRWLAEGHQLVTDEKAITPAVYEPRRRNEAIRALKDEVAKSLGNSAVTILDNRSDDEFTGRSNNLPGKPDFGAERYGHIPGAKQLNFVNLLDETESLLDPAVIRQKLEAAGATPDKRVICYCRRSHRAALVCFTMIELLGYTDVRNYDGSWTEWGTAVGMPIER